MIVLLEPVVLARQLFSNSLFQKGRDVKRREDSGMLKRNRQIESYDATPREGRQAMGVNFGLAALIAIIEKLSQLGIDVIECGWPGAHQTWDQLFQAIGRGEVKLSGNTKLAAFSRTRLAGVSIENDKLFQKLLSAPVQILTIFGKCWSQHVVHALKTNDAENLKMVEESIAAACATGKRVVFDAEHFFQGYKQDGSEYVFAILRAAIAGGADTLVLCDTNGIAYPWEVDSIVAHVVMEFGDQATIGVHMHGDRGLALANTLSALRSGARHFQGTANGYSERVKMACDLEVMANLKLLEDEGQTWSTLNPAFNSSILKQVSREIDRWAGLHPYARKPFVGRACSTHKAGVHVSGGERAGYNLYESHNPTQFGRHRHIVLSGMAGQTGVKAFVKAAWGINLEDCSTIETILAEVEAQEAKGFSFDSCSGSAALLIAKLLWPEQVSRFQPQNYHFSTPPSALPGEIMAHVGLGDGEYSSACGDGPVDALCKAALKAVVEQHSCLRDLTLDEYAPYQLQISGKEGTASAMRVEIDWQSEKLGSFTTQGVSTNIIDASWGAIIEAISLALIKQWRNETVPQGGEIGEVY